MPKFGKGESLMSCIRTMVLLSSIFFLWIPYARGEPSAEKLNERAHALFMRGRISKSIAFYQQVLKFSPTALSPYLNLAIAFRTLGQNSKAREALETALKLSPESPEIQTELGWLYLREGKFKESETQFLQVLKIKKEDAFVLFGLGVAALFQGQPKESIKFFERASALQPKFSAIYYFLGKAYEELGELRQAEKNYVTTLRRDWTFAEARIALAHLYKKLAEEEHAYSQYATLYKLNPTIVEAKNSVQKLSEKYKEEPMAPAEVVLQFSTASALFSNKDEIKIRVGLWTSASGKPLKLKSIKFASSAGFKVIGMKSRKVFAEGKGREIWEAISVRRRVWDLKSPDGKKWGPFAHGVEFQPQKEEQNFLVWGMNEVPEPWKKMEFRGSIQIFPHRRGGIYLVNELYLEDYLAGVVPKEMPSEWPLEALKAQAIIARNQAVLRKKSSRPHHRFFYDLCDGQHCQVYGGLKAETERARKAVMETRGKLLFFKNALAYTYYHSNCGGATRSADAVWGSSKISYLAGRRDSQKQEKLLLDSPWELNRWIKSAPESNCRFDGLVSSIEYRWLRIVPAKILERKLNQRYRIGKLKAVIPLQRDGAGHVVELLLKASKRKVILRKEYEIRQTLGLESLRSTLFLIEAVRDANGHLKEFWFYGGGWGHGVGLCQSGAAGVAGQGNKNAEEILTFYFPGTELR